MGVTFDVNYVNARSDLVYADTGETYVYGVAGSSDTVMTLDRDAPVSAFGDGRLTLDPAHVVFDGRRQVRSRGTVVAGGVLAVVCGFLLAVMWQGERWPPAGIAVLVALVTACVFLFARAKRVEPFHWRVPWGDIKGFHEASGDNVDWLVTIAGTHVGTLAFVVAAAQSDELTDVLVEVQENELTRVTFREREVPTAIAKVTRPPRSA